MVHTPLHLDTEAEYIGMQQGRMFAGITYERGHERAVLVEGDDLPSCTLHPDHVVALLTLLAELQEQEHYPYDGFSIQRNAS